MMIEMMVGGVGRLLLVSSYPRKKQDKTRQDLELTQQTHHTQSQRA